MYSQSSLPSSKPDSMSLASLLTEVVYLDMMMILQWTPIASRACQPKNEYLMICVMVEMAVNTMVLVLWSYLAYMRRKTIVFFETSIFGRL